MKLVHKVRVLGYVKYFFCRFFKLDNWSIKLIIVNI